MAVHPQDHRHPRRDTSRRAGRRSRRRRGARLRGDREPLRRALRRGSDAADGDRSRARRSPRRAAASRRSASRAEAESFGKAAIVGEKGELEHAAALLHPKMGTPVRAALGKGPALIPSAKKMGARHRDRRSARPQGRGLRALAFRRDRSARRPTRRGPTRSCRGDRDHGFRASASARRRPHQARDQGRGRASMNPQAFLATSGRAGAGAKSRSASNPRRRRRTSISSDASSRHGRHAGMSTARRSCGALVPRRDRGALDGGAFRHRSLRAPSAPYWMHLARRDLVLQNPRRGDQVHGTFALRSPVRPDPIASSSWCSSASRGRASSCAALIASTAPRSST